MRKIYSDGGWLHYPPLEFFYMQGEKLAINFIDLHRIKLRV